MNRVSPEVAHQDVSRWLDFKRVNERKREVNKDFVDSLENEVEDGLLTVDENCVLNYELKVPLTDDNGNETITELSFKPRLKVNEVEKYLKGVKAGDGDGRLMAYIAALTNKPVGVIKGLYTEDITICQAIALFFV